MEQTMRKIGKQMSVLMGLTLSFVLSLVGNLHSGHFTLPGFLMSFALSAVIALAIGFIVPIGKLNQDLQKRLGLPANALKTRILSSLMTDLIYTPVITLSMVYLAYSNARRMGAPVSFAGMFVPSLLLSLVIAFFLSFFLEPIFMKYLMRRAGIADNMK